MKYGVLLSFVLFLVTTTIAQQKVYPYFFQGKYGLVTTDNEKVTEPIYDKLFLMSNQEFNRYAVYGSLDDNNKLLYGIINSKGDVVVEAKYSFIRYDGNGALFITSTKEDMVDVVQISTQKTIASFETGRYTIHHKMIEYTPKDAPQSTVVFGNGRMVEYESSYPKKSEIVFPEKPCPYILVDGTYYDCNGVEFTEDDVYATEVPEFMDWAVAPPSYSKAMIKKELDETKAKFLESHTTVVPVMQDNGRWASYILDQSKLVSQSGNVLYEDKDNCPILTSYRSMFSDDETYVSCGYQYDMGLLTTKGKVLLKREFTSISTLGREAKADLYVQRSTKEVPDLFVVSHKSGYAGLANKYGYLYLPKVCNCLEK